MLRLLKSCENAKKKILSYQNQINIELDNLFEREDLNIVITREIFENLYMDLFKKCISYLEQAIKESKINKEKIGEIVLLGGSSRIQKIRQMMQEFFNGKEINISTNPEEAVIFGAAIKEAIVS